MILIQDYIKCYENILDPEVCERIIKEENYDFKRATIHGGITSSARKCYAQFVDKKFDSILYESFGKILKLYREEFVNFSTGLTCEDTGYQHLWYKGMEEGEYKEHTDHFDLQPRTLSCSLILNDDYDGGDFSFFNGEHIIPKKTGDAVVFPSNFCFPHSVTPVTSGDRHSVVTWFH